MKLNKDQIQKIILGILLLIGFLYCYFNLLIGPLTQQKEDALKTTAELTPKIADAKSLIGKVHALEKNAPKTGETLRQIQAMIPPGAPIAWFPPQIADFFNSRDIQKSLVRMGGETGEKNLPGFNKLLWNLYIPRVEIAQLGSALTDLENDRPLLEINSLQIGELGGNVQYQSANINISIIVKK